MPDPDTLDIGSDFAAFLRDEVDPLLRRAALRRLWQLDPAFSELDGLLEYGEDYTDAARGTAVVRTAFRFVGDVLTLTECEATEHSAETPASPGEDPGGCQGRLDATAAEPRSSDDESQRS